jgi:glycosyltransferase involved in cell wall biosynthesis
MSLQKKIILDCDLMRHRNSGLYHYCLNLGLEMDALLREKEEAKMSFYIPPAERQSFGNAHHIVEKKTFWNFFNPFLKRCNIWHAPFQSGRVFPDRKKYPGIRILLTIHDLNPLHEGKPPEEQRKSLAHTQSLIDRSDAVVCISEFCKKDVLANCEVGRKKVHVIYNGIHKVHPPRLSGISYRPAHPFLFGMGYVNTKKNYHVLLPLLKNENLELVIAGKLDEPTYIDRMLETARKMGVEERLHLLGPVSEGEKSWYLENALAFVHPSLAEGFGAPVVEAMQFGKPLFLSSLTSLPEIAGNAAFYFNSFSEDHMREVFENGLNRFKTENLSGLVKEQARRFNWKEKAREYLEVYRSLYE